MEQLYGNVALGLSTALSLNNLFYCFVGVFLGTVVGVIPAGAGALDPTVFRADAASWFDDAFLRTLVRRTALLTQSISLDQGVHP